jgi:gliding motility-associated-like protein
MHTVRIDYQLNFYVPSAFTPNGDQINEEFQVYSDGINYNDFEMLIFDRWGNQVFATTNPFEKWNGAYFNDGEILADGIYVYHVNFTQLYDIKKHTYIGRVALIK